MVKSISFVVNPIYAYGEKGWSPESNRLGGSEEFVVEAAKRLAKNYEIQVFHNGKHGMFDGVKYRNHLEFKPGDVTINVNYPQFSPQGKTIYWTSLTENPDLSKFDAVCVISEYAKQHTGVKHKNVYIVSPGYDSERIYPGKKIPKQCFYASSPDRGLNKLLEVWPEVMRAHSDATLLLTYGAYSDLPGVISLGEADEDTMNQIYRTSDIWAYPCKGNELYCMTGIKAQAAGCIPVVIPNMALAETVRYGYKATEANFASTLIGALGSDNKNISKMLAQEIYPDWGTTTSMLLSIIEGIYHG